MARDHSRTLQRRNELAYARGYRGADGGVSGAYAAERRARAAGAQLEGDTGARPDLRQIQPIGSSGRRLVRDLPTTSGGERTLRSQLRGAERVRISATLADGRQVDVLSKGGWSAARFAQLVDELGSVAAAVSHVIATIYSDDLGGGGEAPDLSDFSLDLT